MARRRKALDDNPMLDLGLDDVTKPGPLERIAGTAPAEIDTTIGDGSTFSSPERKEGIRQLLANERGVDSGERLETCGAQFVAEDGTSQLCTFESGHVGDHCAQAFGRFEDGSDVKRERRKVERDFDAEPLGTHIGELHMFAGEPEQMLDCYLCGKSRAHTGYHLEQGEPAPVVEQDTKPAKVRKPRTPKRPLPTAPIEPEPKDDDLERMAADRYEANVGEMPPLEDVRSIGHAVDVPSSYPASMRTRARVTFVEVNSADLVQFDGDHAVDRLIEGGPTSLAGAIVKVSPVVQAANREAFDASMVAQSARDRGAVAVIVAPRIVADARLDDRRAEAVRRAASPREAIAAWFNEIVGLPDDDRAACIEVAEQLLEEDGQ